MAMENLDKALADVVEKLDHLASDQAGPAIKGAATLAGKVYQYSAIGDLAQWPILLIVTLSSIWVFQRSLLILIARIEKADDFTPDQVSMIVLVIVSAIVGVTCLIGTVITFFMYIMDPLIWASAFDGNVALAAHILNSVSGSKH